MHIISHLHLFYILFIFFESSYNAYHLHSLQNKYNSNTSKTSNTLQRSFTALQPSGNLHIGNYFGCIKQYVESQSKYQTFVCVADLHALTTCRDPSILKRCTLQSIALHLACRLDPNKSTLFIQSHIHEHTMFSWLLSCIIPQKPLERMHHFKSKIQNKKEAASVALCDYPLLMAADVLLYKATHIPVGVDQLQHIEFIRMAVRKLNQMTRSVGGANQFIEPHAECSVHGNKVMSLLDGNKKMSKSDASDFSRINLLDSSDTIAMKIKKCKSDSFIGMQINDTHRPECINLIQLFSLVTNNSIEDVALQYNGINWNSFKNELTDAINQFLKPIQLRYQQYMKEPSYLYDIIKTGGQRASSTAATTLRETKELFGILV